MKNQSANKILQRYSLRKTACRKCVLDLFLKNDFALANANIEKEIGKDFDRVTIYRTLRTFLGKGIIHKVLDDEANPKFALCNIECSEGTHNHDHVHFKCNSCGQTNCLNDVKIPLIQLPDGYQLEETNLLINGICKECNYS